MKNLLMNICCLILLAVMSTCQSPGSGTELPGGAADVVTGPGRWMGCGAPTTVPVHFYSFRVFTSNADVVYRRQAVLKETLQLAGGTTFELPASNIGDCAKQAAKAGLAAFEFNKTCLAYKSSLRFFKCNTSCDRVVFVTDDICAPKGGNLVPLDEAPWQDGGVEGSRLYMLQKLFYLEHSNAPMLRVVDFSESEYLMGYSFAALQNGTILPFSYYDADLYTCLYYDTAAGLPSLISPVFFNHNVIAYYFLDECGGTLQLKLSEVIYKMPPEVFGVDIYSHRGFGCTEFPGKNFINCTVHIAYDKGFILNTLTEGLNNVTGKCDGFTFTADHQDGKHNDICGKMMYVFQKPGSVSLTLRGSAADPRLGFNIRVIEQLKF